MRRKYGYDCICGISTKGYASIKKALRIAGRYLGALYNDSNAWQTRADQLCKLYDSGEGALSSVRDAAGMKIIEYGKLLVGCFTGYGQHAAGTIISGDAVMDSLPLMYGEGKDNMETSCNMGQAEAKGYLKMDFLGLKNLDIITRILRQTKDAVILDGTRQPELLGDLRIYREIYAKGLTHGVFQFESPGMKTLLQRFQPECFEDICLLNASYRPGPMQYLDEIIAEKWYRKAKADPAAIVDNNGNILLNGQVYEKPVHSINIDNDDLKEILTPTYGCIIYQEQIMQICTKLAGFTMGHADNIRKYMSKKKAEKLAAERPAFVQGCMEHSGLSESDANHLFDCMIDFAKYAFNKSHACMYSLVSVITAYLKLYHPAIFFAESLNAIEELDEILDFTKEMPLFGITLHAPDIKHSSNQFIAVSDDVYYGLSYVKGLSEITFERAETFTDFIAINHNTIKEKTLEKLILCGLFDSMEPSISRTDLIGYSKELYNAVEGLEKQEALLNQLQGQQAFLATYLPKKQLSLSDKQHIVSELSLRKAVNKLTRKDIDKYLESNHTKQNKCRMDIEKQLSVMNDGIKSLRLTSSITPEDIALSRKKEKELLGYVFNIKGSIDRLEHCNTFPDNIVDTRTPVETTIPNLGLIVIDPCVKVTPGGWTKVLCCDKNRTYKNLYFAGGFDENITEFVITFEAERLQERRDSKDGSTNSNNMYVAPHAYSINDIGYQPMKHYNIENLKDFRSAAHHVKAVSNATATLYCMEGDISIRCKDEDASMFLTKNHIPYTVYEDTKLGNIA